LNASPKKLYLTLEKHQDKSKITATQLQSNFNVLPP